MDKLIVKFLKNFLILFSLLIFSCVWDDWGPPTQYPVKNAYPDFAYDGQNFFFVWGGDDIYGRIISPEGDYVTPIFEISSSDNIEAEPEIIFLGSSFVIIWEEHLREEGVRICYKKYNRYYSQVSNSSTELLRGHGLSSPRIEKHAKGFVVLWYEWESVCYYCNISLFNLSGVELKRRMLGTSPYPRKSVSPLVRADSVDRYLLSRGASFEILDHDLETINDIDFPGSEEIYSCYGYDKWLSFVDRQEDSYPCIGHLTIRKIGLDGSVMPPDSIVIESDMNHFRNLTVCPGNNIFLCVWQQYDDEGSTVNYIRLDSEGNIIDDESFLLYKNVHFGEARLKYAEDKFFWLWKSWRYDEGEDAEFDEKILCCILPQGGGPLSAKFVTVAK